MKGLLVLFVFASFVSFGQQSDVDSLLKALSKPVKNDTMRAFQFNELAWNYLDIHVDSALLFSKKGYVYSKKIGYLSGEMDALNTQGIIYRYQSKYELAKQIYEQLIQQAQAANRLDKLTGYYSNLGSVYYEQAKFGKALAYYKKAFENAELFNQSQQKLILINNLGVGFKQVGLYEKALDWFQLGLKEAKKSGDKIQEGTIYGNIATVYFDKGMHVESSKYSLQALALLEKENALARAPNLLFNLLIDYRLANNYKEAKKILQKYKRFAEQMDDAKIWSDYYLSQSKLQGDLGQYKDAERAMEKALSYIDKQIDPLQYGVLLMNQAQLMQYQNNYELGLKLAYEAERAILQTEDSTSLISLYAVLKELNRQTHHFEEALKYAELESIVKTRLESAVVSTQIATLNALNELEKRDQALQMANENTKRLAAESERKSSLIYGMVAVGVLTLIILFLTYRSNANRKKANALLQDKNKEIEQQKALIETKQEEILSSIHYAKRIQETLLAQRELINHHLPDSFILFKPKDIVSGDFYWGSVVGNKLFLAICDSTGHGVPGAFMSALNSSFLNEAVNQLNLTDPGAIFNHVRSRLISSISHDGAKDGMDGVLLCFDLTNRSVTYAAAYNPPLILRNNEVIKCPVDRMPVGLSDDMRDFKSFPLMLEKGDKLYVTTDGFVDQFGGEDQKKLKWKGFSELLVLNKEKKVVNQLPVFDAFFETWKAECEQIDDVCVLGIEWF